jgi:hypothetical protein
MNLKESILKEAKTTKDVGYQQLKDWYSKYKDELGYPEHNNMIQILKKLERKAKGQVEVSDLPVVKLQIGRKTRTEHGIKGTYTKLAPKLSSSCFIFAKDLEDKFNITWTNGIIYKVDQAYSGSSPSQVGTGFAMLGKDDKGREFMYDRRTTYNPGAGQSFLHSPNGSIQVTEAQTKPVDYVLQKLNFK